MVRFLVVFCIILVELELDYEIYSYFHKKTQREFLKVFFSAIFQTHENQQRPSFSHFLTDKGPNIVSQYDFWTINIFTSLGLTLKMFIFLFIFSEILSPSVARKFFSWTKHDRKINFKLFWIQRVQIVIGCHVYFHRNTRNTESSFWYKSVLSMYFSTVFQKRIFQFSQWNYIETYKYLYSLDSEKSKPPFLSFFVKGKKSPGQTRPQNFGQKIRKMIIFKANPRLVKIVII
jgi:hypothetical protein